MKKFGLFIAALMMLGGLAIAGESWVVPSAANSNPINADYGGVDIATNSFYVGFATVPTGVNGQGISYRDFYASTTTINNIYATNRWRIYGVNFSTGNCADRDFVTIQVSSASLGQARELTRIYNSVVITTGTAVGANVCGGVTYTRWPIRAYGNLFWGVNSVQGVAVPANPYNRADLLYYKEGD